MTNNKFKVYEILTVIVLLIIVFAILSSFALSTINGEKFRSFRQNALSFSQNASTYSINHNKQIIYLSDLIDDGSFSKIRNVFDSKSSCDIYESKVIVDKVNKVILRCGNYLINGIGSNFSDYTIYKVSDWKSEQKKDDEELVGYSYNNSNYLDDIDFINYFNRENKTSFTSINDISSNYTIVSNKVYRSVDKISVKEN